MSDHAWCRDEAVRAAEDGRQGPLPTLEEAIATITHKGTRMTKSEAQAADYRAEAISRAGQFADSKALEWRKCPERDNRVDDMRPPTTKTATVENDFAVVAKCSPALSETGETQSGLRTERVTLEVKHDCKYPAAEWVLEVVQEACSDPGESVRVVEEMPAFAPATAIAGGTVLVNGQDMVTLVEFLRHTTRLTQEAGVAKAERDAAIRERDELRTECERLRGKVAAMEGQSRMDIEREIAVEEAWESCDIRPHWPDDEPGTSHRYAESMRLEIVRLRSRVAELEEQLESVACRAATAETENEKLRARVRDWERVHQAAHLMASLESAPAASGAAGTGWLTEEERGVLETVAYEAETSASKPRWEQVARVTRSILARSSPPEVVLPVSWTETNHENRVLSAKEVIAALAAAGVNVKEVGRE